MGTVMSISQEGKCGWGGKVTHSRSLAGLITVSQDPAGNLAFRKILRTTVGHTHMSSWGKRK